MNQKPYLLRAIHECCVDAGHTPYLATVVDERTRVPLQYVKDGQITLNISYDATTNLQMGNEMITFNTRFSGQPHQIEVPVENVLALFARENGEGVAFPVVPATAKPPVALNPEPVPATPQPRECSAGKGFLKLVSNTQG